MSDLESLLIERLATVIEPEIRPSTDLADGLRRRHDRHRRFLATAGLGGVGCALAGVALVASALGHDGMSTLTVSTSPQPTASPVPSISPAFAPTSGRDWLPDQEQAAAFKATHPYPSFGPEAPGTSADRLLQEVQHAGLPATSVLLITDHGSPTVRITLASGVPIVVSRYQKQYPNAFDWGAGKPRNTTYEVVDIPDTTDAAALLSNTGYGWPLHTPGDNDANHDGDPQNDSPSVNVVTAGGLSTFWVAPPAVALRDLERFAFTAADWSYQHPQ